MPNVVHGSPSYAKPNFETIDYHYPYPNGWDLHPSSEFHAKLLARIMDRARMAYESVSTRFDAWRKVDRTLTAYIPLDDAEKELKQKDPRRPVSVVFPYSYAMLESLLAYLMMAFSREPIFRYEGVSPEDTIGAILLEKVVQLHCHRAKVPLNLHTMFRDSLAYGFGPVAPYWEVRHGKRTISAPGTLYDYSGRLAREQGSTITVDAVLYEGNALNNIDPYHFLPDPNVAIHEVQSGEFVGWSVKDNLMSMLREEQQDSDMFNVKYLRHMKGKTSQYHLDESDREKKARNTGGGSTPTTATGDSNRVDKIYMYVDLIPADWGLGPSEYPSKWCFCVAADAVIIKAYETSFNHGMYPVAVCAPDFDGNSPTPISRLEILYGLQHVLDFLFNSHIANVRKAVNDMIIVDPQLVNINDLKDPQPGKLVRLRRPAWGRGVKDVAMQLSINDLTRANIADSSWVVQWMQKIAATDDPVMGSLRQGGPERLTKGEFAGTQQGAYSRLARIAQIIGYQAMLDIGYMFATHTQQLMTKEAYIKVNGRWKEDLMAEYGAQVSRDRLKVDPTQLLIEYDVFVRDGSIPGSNFTEAWLRLFDIISKSEPLIQQFDVVRVFEHIARSLGAKNVEDFKRQQPVVQPMVAPDNQVLGEAQKGNLVPMQALGGM